MENKIERARKNYLACNRTFKVYQIKCVKNTLEPVQMVVKTNKKLYIADEYSETWASLKQSLNTCAPIDIRINTKQVQIKATKAVYRAFSTIVDKKKLLQIAKNYGYSGEDLFYDMENVKDKVFELNGKILEKVRYKNAILGNSDERLYQLKPIYQLNKKFNAHIKLPQRAYVMFENGYEPVVPTTCTLTKAQFNHILFYAEAYGVNIPTKFTNTKHHGKDSYDVYDNEGVLHIDKGALEEVIETLNYLMACGDDYLMPGFRRDGNKLFRVTTQAATGKYVHDEGIFLYDAPEEEEYIGLSPEPTEVVTFRPVDRLSNKEFIVYKDYNDLHKAIQNCKDSLE